jgi:hypothetical protein
LNESPLPDLVFLRVRVKATGFVQKSAGHIRKYKREKQGNESIFTGLIDGALGLHLSRLQGLLL